MEKKTVISISNLVKKYGDFKAVDKLSFEVLKGEVFGFLGPNGSGKTTTINMICGLSQATEGSVRIFGKKLKEEGALKAMIGYCPQENIFWPKLTPLEQLVFMGQMYGMKTGAAKSRSKELLDLMGLEKKTSAYAKTLSGGMKRRLSICLAVVHDPSILILDEPEAGLDPQSRILVRKFIKQLAEEKTVILTTHNMDEADRLADRVGIIDQGRLLLIDSPQNLKKSVGEGDTLEIKLGVDKLEETDQLNNALSKICRVVNIEQNTLFVRSGKMMVLIPAISELITEMGYPVKEMTLRENTLEDVFIHLTGKTLRQ